MKLDSKTNYGLPIVLIGLLLTSLATFYVSKKNSEEDKLRFEYEMNFIIRRIQARMENYEGALIQTRAFILNSPTIQRENLRNYIKDTQIFRRFPGLQGIGVAQIVKKENLGRHEKTLKKDVEYYQVWPEGFRNIYTPINVLEPSDKRNRKALGFDMYSEPERRKAMDIARDEDKAMMTEKIILVQEDKGERLPGFNLYLPFYKNESDFSTLQGRRNNIVGFVYSPFRTHELFNAIFSEIDSKLDVEIFAGNKIDEAHLFYDSTPPINLKKKANGLSATKTLILNGQDITLKFYESKEFRRAQTFAKIFFVAVGGLLVTLLLLWLYLLTRKQMLLARRVAEENEKLLLKEKAHVEARDDFLSIASHELKTPLTSLKLQGEVMKRMINKGDEKALSKEKVINLVNHIENQTTRLTRLVDDMLDISRIRTGKLRVEKSQIELCEVVNDVIDRLKPQFAKNSITVPQVESDAKIIGNWDRFRIEQVVTNLLTNAIRYGKNNPVKVRITKLPPYACIEVIDQGIGIAKENVGKIFDRFERAAMSANEVSGLGLGLYITNQIVLAHKGRIEVESELGKGSTFKVLLPLSD